MPSHRAERLNSDFRRELAMIITRMKDPRISPLLEVVRVKVTSDLSYAKVYIASVGGGEEAAEACRVLQGAEGFLKTELAHTMKNIRKIPSLQFVPDDSVDYYNRIDSILKGLNSDGNPEDQS
ncbi:MAG: 30S ribosome-binding factor RbfA [Oscillospiraceae bacterium]|jgi:ribosome-binding factor A|nr:30S ribosome-binding factor RbfA [Oscillospiraceae bacterium]